VKREDILAAYEMGPDAVCELVLTVTGALEARIAELEQRLGKNSSNSSKPPSSDGLQRTTSLRPRDSGRKPGGQPGHDGHTLRPSAQPDEIVPLPLKQCKHCQEPLEQVEPAGEEKRQVFELPPPRLRITEYRAERKKCPHCGLLQAALFPKGVEAPVQYGPGFNALMTHLHVTHLLPVERTADLCGELCGHRPGLAAVLKSVEQAAARMAGTVGEVAEALAQAPVVHADETGVRCEKKTGWLHTCGTANLTHYSYSPRRGVEGFAAAGILGRFKGVAVHDFWRPYQTLECAHGYCNAHLLRELKFMRETCQHPWAGEMSALLLEMKSAADSARQAGQAEVSPAVRQALEARYGEQIAAALLRHPANEQRAAGRRGGRIKQSPEHCLLARLDKERADVLRFLGDLSVPFDNNLAERDLRMIKVQQKISGCFRTQAGAEIFCTVRSYLSTAKKLGLGLLDSIADAFRGSPFSVPSV